MNSTLQLLGYPHLWKPPNIEHDVDGCAWMDMVSPVLGSFAAPWSWQRSAGSVAMSNVPNSAKRPMDQTTGQIKIALWYH